MLVGAGEARRRVPSSPLFAEVLALFEQGDVSVTAVDGRVVDVRDLPLADFHTLRAIVLKAGLVFEEAIQITCRNCDATMTVQPCHGLELGPLVDDERDEELDATAPFGRPFEVEDTVVTFAARTVAEAAPLFTMLGEIREDPAAALRIDAGVVQAMGIAALGRETDPASIAAELARCSETTFGAITDCYLASHYPLRLGSVAICAACNARNDVDAPFEREFDVHAGPRDDGPRDAFPAFDAFAGRAVALAEPYLDQVPGERVLLVIEGETPAVDDGGEPLLGSYVPPYAGDAGSPSRAPTVTLYFRTFLAMWNEDGPYDWEAEIEETVEHELEHHIHFLRGDDPLDDEERDAIDEEVARVVGQKEVQRRAASATSASLVDFVKRTWPLWVIAAIALALSFFVGEQ